MCIYVSNNIILSFIENEGGNFDLGLIEFSDPDASDTFTLSLDGNSFDNVEWFSVDPNTSHLIYNANQDTNINLDFETTEMYTLNVTVTDSQSETSHGILKVQVINVNEPPSFVLNKCADFIYHVSICLERLNIN